MAVLYWIIFGSLMGSCGTYLLYEYRGYERERGALLGGLLGAVGNLVLLIPLWAHTLLGSTPLGQLPTAATGPATLHAPTTRYEFAREPSKWFKPALRVAIYAFLIGMMFVYLLPVYTVVATSLKTPQEAGKLDSVWKFPSSPHWESYEVALTELAPKIRNSFLLTLNATIISALMGSMNGYVLAKWRFPGAKIVFPLMLFGMFIPYQSILIPLFQFVQDINLGGSLLALILAHVVYGLPITTLIFRNYYAEVPTEMVEAGFIDGAGFFGVYRWILFPLSLPGFVVVVIWQFTQIWNEFLFAVTLTNENSQPITVALALLAGGEAVKWNLPMAGAVLAALPTLIVYIVLGRYFIRGLLAGSVKG
jgi:glucose/mannose transport system permease protein